MDFLKLEKQFHCQVSVLIEGNPITGPYLRDDRNFANVTQIDAQS